MYSERSTMYLFLYDALHVSDGFSVHHHELKTAHTASGIFQTVMTRLKQIASNSVYNLSQYLTNLMHKICFTISFISCLYMFRAHVLETCRGMK